MTSSPIGLLSDSNLLLRIEKHKKLLALVKEALPLPLSEHCLDCCVTEKNNLLVFCENSSWAFNLRFYSEQILSYLRGRGIMAGTVQIRLLPPASGDPEQKRRTEYFDCAAAAGTLKALADAMPQDDLSESLKRLVETLSSI